MVFVDHSFSQVAINGLDRFGIQRNEASPIPFACYDHDPPIKVNIIDL